MTGFSIFIGVFFLVIMFCGYCANCQTTSAYERKIQGYKDVQYEVKYNIKNRKFYILMSTRIGDSWSDVHNKHGFVKYYKSASLATVEMEKLKGNFL